MDKIKSGTLTAETFKNTLKERIERFVANDNAFSFTSSSYWRGVT